MRAAKIAAFFQKKQTKKNMQHQHDERKIKVQRLTGLLSFLQSTFIYIVIEEKLFNPVFVPLILWATVAIIIVIIIF